MTQHEFKKTLTEILEKVIAHRPVDLAVRLLFQDEARFGRLSDRRPCWAPWPSRPTVGQQVIREYPYALAAVSPLDGRLFTLVLPWVDTEAMSLFPAQTAVDFLDEYCIMLLDGAGWHRATALRIPPMLCLISLPPYSPELNPVEHFWEHLREDYFGNRALPSLSAVTDRLCEGLRDLDQQPEQTKPVTYFDWIETLSLTLNQFQRH